MNAFRTLLSIFGATDAMLVTVYLDVLDVEAVPVAACVLAATVVVVVTVVVTFCVTTFCLDLLVYFSVVAVFTTV